MPSGILRLGDAARGGILEGVRLHQGKEQSPMTRRQHTAPETPQTLDLMTPGEAAEFLHLSPITLSHYRYQGRGPVYRKHGWRVFYLKADLLAWSERQRWASTAEPIRGPS